MSIRPLREGRAVQKPIRAPKCPQGGLTGARHPQGCPAAEALCFLDASDWFWYTAAIAALMDGGRVAFINRYRRYRPDEDLPDVFKG